MTTVHKTASHRSTLRIGAGFHRPCPHPWLRLGVSGRAADASSLVLQDANSCAALALLLRYTCYTYVLLSPLPPALLALPCLALRLKSAVDAERVPRESNPVLCQGLSRILYMGYASYSQHIWETRQLELERSVATANAIGNATADAMLLPPDAMVVTCEQLAWRGSARLPRAMVMHRFLACVAGSSFAMTLAVDPIELEPDQVRADPVAAAAEAGEIAQAACAELWRAQFLSEQERAEAVTLCTSTRLLCSASIVDVSEDGTSTNIPSFSGGHCLFGESARVLEQAVDPL